MIQADATLTMSQDGTVGIIETSLVVDDEPTHEQIAAAIFTANQHLNRTIAAALTIGEKAPDTVPDNLTTRTE